jgi:hypothetical protein
MGWATEYLHLTKTASVDFTLGSFLGGPTGWAGGAVGSEEAFRHADPAHAEEARRRLGLGSGLLTGLGGLVAIPIGAVPGAVVGVLPGIHSKRHGMAFLGAGLGGLLGGGALSYYTAKTLGRYGANDALRRVKRSTEEAPKTASTGFIVGSLLGGPVGWAGSAIGSEEALDQTDPVYAQEARRRLGLGSGLLAGLGGLASGMVGTIPGAVVGSIPGTLMGDPRMRGIGSSLGGLLGGGAASYYAAKTLGRYGANAALRKVEEDMREVPKTACCTVSAAE